MLNASGHAERVLEMGKTLVCIEDRFVIV